MQQGCTLHAMTSRLLVLVLLVLAACAGGCTPSPAKTCERIADIDARSKGAAKSPKDVARCLDVMGPLKQQEEAKYACLAKCVGSADDMAGLSRCDDSCNTKGIAAPVAAAAPAEAPGAPAAGGGAGGGCRDACKRTLDACMGGCGDEVQCHEKCNAAYTKCGVDCVH